MYKRSDLSKGNSKEKQNEHKRHRNVILNFRVTPEEKEKIEKRMAVSGLTKQDFLIQSLINQQVVCVGNVKSFEEMRTQLAEIGERLKEVTDYSEIDPNDLETIRMILELYVGLNLLNAKE